MALLSRMYAGWKRDDGDLRKGIGLIDRKGPYDNLYYCYFASQVMKNWGGAEWNRWNERLRDDLVRLAGPRRRCGWQLGTAGSFGHQCFRWQTADHLPCCTDSAGVLPQSADF
jgi:hypothetical protein